MKTVILVLFSIYLCQYLETEDASQNVVYLLGVGVSLFEELVKLVDDEGHGILGEKRPNRYLAVFEDLITVTDKSLDIWLQLTLLESLLGQSLVGLRNIVVFLVNLVY
jgi:hypothetical protein